MKSRSVFARGLVLAVLACVSVSLVACHRALYRYYENNYAGRATPPSGLQQRVLAAYTNGGATGTTGGTGGLEILDGLRDIRSNVQNTTTSYFISGYSGANPTTILNFPEEQMGYVLDSAAGGLAIVNYSSESSTGSEATYGANPPSVGGAETGALFAAPSASGGYLYVTAGGATYALNLPNVYRVSVNASGSIILAMTRNTNSLYRVLQIPVSANPVTPPGAIDCQPRLIPLYCVVPVKGTFDRPISATYSTDGNSVYIMNAGPEYGGTASSVSVVSASAVVYNNIPTVDPASTSAPTAMQTLSVTNPISVPGGATVGLSDGTNLYVAGQSTTDYTGGTLTSSTAASRFTGYLTKIPLSTYVPASPISISDGYHTKLLFADNDTLWAGSNTCSTGKREAIGVNYNCLTRLDISGTAPVATIVPNVTPNGSTTVPYPNENGNQYYYGDLTGICWVQNWNKVYTAYGGQIHVFETADGSEINNYYVTVQGTVLDVAYMDALTNAAN